MTKDVCPVCQQPAVYARETDRYFHLDGSDNFRCWLRIGYGEAFTPARPVNDAPFINLTPLHLRLHGHNVVRATRNLYDAVNRYCPDETSLAAVLRYLLASVHDSSTGDGEMWVTDDQPALHGLPLWAQRDPDGYVLLLPVDA